MQTRRKTDFKRFLAIFALIVIISVFWSGSTYAEGSAKAGADKARACQVCHGKGGFSTKSTYPILAGQHAEYIQKQLKAFREGTRKDPIMSGMASDLTDQDIEDLAAFFNSSK